MSKSSSTSRASDFSVMTGAAARVIFTAAIVWLVYFFRGNVYFRLYPAVVCLAVLTSFVVSSFKTPIVEAIARRRGVALDAQGVKYCRKVNRAWIVFLSAHFAVTLASVFLSLEFWAFYNGFLSYMLIASMFLGEWAIRRRKKKEGSL